MTDPVFVPYHYNNACSLWEILYGIILTIHGKSIIKTESTFCVTFCDNVFHDHKTFQKSSVPSSISYF